MDNFEIMDNFEYQEALNIIPELEDSFNINMSLESFLKKDLLAYFNIGKVVGLHCGVEKCNLIYNFEIEYGSAQITINNYGTLDEFLTWNNVMQHHINEYSGLTSVGQ